MELEMMLMCLRNLFFFQLIAISVLLYPECSYKVLRPFMKHLEIIVKRWNKQAGTAPEKFCEIDMSKLD